jgi:hypothetical protein
MTLLSDTAYHSLIGEVEALNTTTIRRLTRSRRHHLLAIARPRHSLLCGGECRGQHWQDEAVRAGRTITRRVALGHPPLHLNRAAHRINDAGKFREQAVARVLYRERQPACVRREFR